MIVNESFFSHFEEDRWIVENLSLPKTGVFVDVGASDGISKSNTYYFEKQGWTGICIDPDPRHAKQLKANRSTVELCAIGTERTQATFYLHSTRPTRSSLYRLNSSDYEEVTSVQCYPLEDILQKHNITEIDLLDIDVEGAELDVWMSFDPNKYKPKIVIIEYADDRPRSSKHEIIGELGKFGYEVRHITPANLILVSTR